MVQRIGRVQQIQRRDSRDRNENMNMNDCYDDMLFAENMNAEISNARVQQMNDVGFQELEKTGEYMETHYYKKHSPHKCKDYYHGNDFIVECLKYLIAGDRESPFLTASFTNVSMKFLPFVLAFMDLPLESKASKQLHKFKSDKKRGINITAGSNIVIFKKEIKQGKCAIKNDMMVSHRYQSMNNRSDDEVEDFIINHPYECEAIMTNVSPKRKQITLLYQIPNGSLPL